MARLVMQANETNLSSSEIIILVVGLAAMGFVLVFLLSNLRPQTAAPAQTGNTASPPVYSQLAPYPYPFPQDPQATRDAEWIATNAALQDPYPVPLNWLTQTVTPGAIQTNMAIGTQRFIGHETEKVIQQTRYVYSTETEQAELLIPTGTFESIYNKYTGQMLGVDAINGWRGLLYGKRVHVYAGSEGPEDPDQGKVCLLFFGQPVNEQCMITSTKHGGLRVIAEQNNRLTLVSTDGTLYYFDVPALQFVDSLDEIVPTATLPPSPTPYPGPG